MANSFLPVYRSGFTGPSKNIGGSTEYHIDLKILKNMPLQERIRAMDSLANQYQSIGRQIEFSNPGVSGKIWNPAAPLAEKVDLLERGAAAHGHSQHQGWDSYDFYVPFKGKSRFDPGAVEGASIYIPAVPGGKIRRGSGGGYGYYSEALDPTGKVVFRVGHGDITRPEEQAAIDVTGDGAATTAAGQTAPAGSSPKDIMAAVFLGNILGEIMNKNQSGAPQQPEADPITGYEDTEEGDIKFLQKLAKNQEQQEAKQDKINEEERYYQNQLAQKEALQTKLQMAEMLKSAQEAYVAPKAVF